MSACPSCGNEVLDIDVRCGKCGAVNGASGAHRMLGKVMLGQYELIDVLGQGGMSVVFKGKHKLTDQEVALKILPPELAAHSQVKSRFLDEAKALAALDHANIVHLYNFGQEDGFFVLAMQFVKGETWERMILESKRLDWTVSCRITIDVLKALEYAHGRGVVHRDMKPSNVLVRAHDGSATVMDFGIAKMTTSTRLTATGQTMGTVRYMSPEQVRGQEVDLKTDIYSLGATLYESLTGDTPFDGSTHFEIMTKHLSEPPKRPSVLGVVVPGPVEDALMRSLSKRAEDRFDSAREMRKILEQTLRQSDVGLSETQKLGRDNLGDLRKTKREAAPPPERVATAQDLADELEPGASSLRGAKRKGLVAIVIGLVVLVAGGGVAALLLIRDNGKPAQAIAIDGVDLKARAKIGNLLVVTDGLIAPQQLADEYAATLEGLRQFFALKQPTLVIADPFEEVVAVPRAALCSPSAYLDKTPPKGCSAALATIAMASQSRRRLYVTSEPDRLAEGLRRGVVEAICYLQPPDPARAAEVCEIAQGFIVGPAGPH